MEVKIDFSKIHDWDSFHKEFAEAMGFSVFYGNNNNAWIDCMSYIDDEAAGMSKITVKPGEVLDIVISGKESATELAPEVYSGFLEIVSDVNQRFLESCIKTKLNVIAD